MKIFSRDKFIKRYGTEECERNRKWVDACNGKEVINGICGCCLIDDSWCIEVPDTKYKPGDKARVKRNLPNKTKGGTSVTLEMKRFRGRIVTISEIAGWEKDRYHIKEDEEDWFWTDEMLEDIKEEEKDNMNKFKVGDIVKGIDEDRYGITNTKMTKGRVIKVRENGMFVVKIIEHECKEYIGDECHDLDPRYFVLAKSFTKSDLKNDDIVTLRNGDRLIYNGEGFMYISYDNDNELRRLSDLQDDLTYDDCGDKDEDYDIVKIERPVEYITVYEREEKQEVKEMTVEEISKALGYEVKIIK